MSDWKQPFVSGSGLCYPSTDYANVNKLTGGNKVNPSEIIKTSFGGSKKKVVKKDTKKKQRGGLDKWLSKMDGPFPPEASLTGSPGEIKGIDEGKWAAPVTTKEQSGGKKQKKEPKKTQRGGLDKWLSEMDGPYPSEASLTGSPGEVKGMDEGKWAAPVSDTKQCGGKKQKKGVKKETNKKQKGGQSLYESEGQYPPEASLLEKSGDVKYFQEGNRLALFSDAKQCGGKKQKKVVKKDTKEKQKGGNESGQTPMPPKWYNPNLKGGMESSGATYAHPAFFDPNIKLKYFPSPEGIRNVGTVDLVPNMPGNTLGNVMKTGGSKLKKDFKKGGELIPRVGDPTPQIRGSINGVIDQFSNFMKELDQSYLNSVKYFSGLKFGGKKENKKEQEQQNVKQQNVKQQNVKQQNVKQQNVKQQNVKQQNVKQQNVKQQSMKQQNVKQQKKKRQKGGDGSDFALTLNSRGPVNAPDDFWGVDGETWFKQFNKSGDYIPNSQLAKAATPLLAGDNPCNIVVGFDEMGNDYGKVDF